MNDSVRRGADLRSRLRRCAARLAQAALLASFAADGAEPRDGAHYILDTIEDIEPDLRDLRALAPPRR